MGWGDELMVTGQVRVHQERVDPRKVRVVYEKGARFHEAWFNNPRFAQQGERGDFQDFVPRQNYLRPYMEVKTHERWTWKKWGPPKGELYFKSDEMKTGDKYAGLVIIEPQIKPGASPNKQWGYERWKLLAKLLKAEGYHVAQMGQGIPAQPIGSANFIWTRTMRLAATVIARAKAVIVPEGALHHVAAATGTPAVVIYGGYISPEVTGYEGQASLFDWSPSDPLGCGWRRPCQHCEQAMAKITPQAVLEQLQALLAARQAA